jgi:hypothetical protein
MQEGKVLGWTSTPTLENPHRTETSRNGEGGPILQKKTQKAILLTNYSYSVFRCLIFAIKFFLIRLNLCSRFVDMNLTKTILLSKIPTYVEAKIILKKKIVMNNPSWKTWRSASKRNSLQGFTNP